MRDRDLKGFGLRVWPSGKKRYFVHSQHRGRRVWKTIASAESTSAGEARAWALTMLATIRRGGDAPASPEEAVFEAVADEVFTRYARNWKPGTLKVNRNYYRNHILPRFKGRPIADIDSRDVRQWFASLHAKPAAADRSAPILSVIMRQAEIYGYRPEGSNPCKGIKRYRREGRERFLSAAEIRSLAAMLDRFEADLPLDRIDRMRVHRWFDEYSRTAPGGANHALDTFRRIMNHAIALGHVETNPTRDVKPNPRAALTRFLSLEEIACLHRVSINTVSKPASLSPLCSQ